MACNYRKQHILDAFFRGALLEDLSLNLFPPADYICTEGAQNAFSHDPFEQSPIVQIKGLSPV
jgi:hypothetical protein